MADIVRRKPEEAQLPALPGTTLPAIGQLVTALGIPREALASDEEIAYAWRDLPRELQQIPVDLRGNLIARMCVAVSTGLFDGAVNYAWNAAVLHLRNKVRNFGLPVVAQILQKDFEDKHLAELQDSELLELCLKLDLITEDGFFFLDQCRDVRNNFSAAHPSVGELNDREFVTFLNRCTKYALAESSSPRGVDIAAFLSAVKGPRFAEGQCNIWVGRLGATHAAQRQLLIGMVHGVYCDPSTPEEGRLNSLELCRALHSRFTADIRSDLINRHSEYLAKGDTQRHTASQQFFEKLDLLGMLNESERHTVISKAVDSLWKAHQAMNNFYNEPPFAERLCQLALQAALPETVKEEYVKAIVGCYVGNGYGYSWAAEPFYEKMIRAFSPREVTIMVQIPEGTNVVAGSIERDGSCKSRFRKALTLIDAASVPSGVKADYQRYIRGMERPPTRRR